MYNPAEFIIKKYKTELIIPAGQHKKKVEQLIKDREWLKEQQ
jgi:hypothetical protein